MCTGRYYLTALCYVTYDGVHKKNKKMFFINEFTSLCKDWGQIIKNLQFIADTWKGENKYKGQKKKQCIIPTTLQQISHHQVAVSWTICGKIVLRLVTPLLSSNNNNQTNHQIKMAHSGLEMWIRERKNVSGVPLLYTMVINATFSESEKQKI